MDFKYCEVPYKFLSSLKLSDVEKYLGISKTKMYTIVAFNQIPYFKNQKVIRIFRQHFNEFLEDKKYTDIDNIHIIKELPNIINAKKISNLLNISESKTYEIIDNESFKMKLGKRIVISKSGFIEWLTLKIHYPA